MDHLIIREGVYLINDTSSNVYYQDENSAIQKKKGFEEVPNGIRVHTLSYLFESSYQINRMFSVLASARLDKPTISNFMFSPRLAIIAEINENNTLRLVAQRSLRMMPIRAQYLYDKHNKDNSDRQNESINAVELAYTRLQGKNVLINLNCFYNEIDAVGFTGEALGFFGKQKQFGGDIELKYTKKQMTIGLNHAYLKLLSFDWNDEFKDGTNKNNITFSDYDYNINKSNGPIQLTSYGNDLNNWSNNATRLFVTYKLFKEKLIVHINSRLVWDTKGGYDEMNMYEEAYNNFDVSQADDPVKFLEEKEVFENEKRLLDEEKAYKTEFTFNASISYKLRIGEKSNLLLTIYSENLLGNNKRYYVSTGSSGTYPSRLKFIEEPTTIGFRIHFSY